LRSYLCAGAAFNMVDEQAWQVEQTCHPANYSHDVQGFDPWVKRGEHVWPLSTLLYKKKRIKEMMM